MLGGFLIVRAPACLRPALAALILIAAFAVPVVHAEPAVPAVPAAGAGSPFTGLDLMSATVFQEGQTSFSGVALRVRMQDARLVKAIDFLPTVEYWQNNVSALGFRTTRRDATLGCDARWTIKTARAWQPYLGLGLGVHFLHSAVKSPTQAINDDTVRGALAGLAGLSFGTSEHFGNFVELKFHNLTGSRELKLNMGLSWNPANRPH